MRVFVLGNTGMLGTYVYKYLKSKDFNIVPINRFVYLDVESPEDCLCLYKLQDSVLINCVGLIPQRSNKNNKYDYIKTNSVFPHKLQELCNRFNAKLIHITTDCVFSGAKGFYSETSTHDCLDIYGRSKSLGEPEEATVIRTSIIGEELQNKKSLLEFVKSNKDGEVNGYINHYWNGVTCLQLAKICEEIISKNLFWKGVKHVTSSFDINKFKLIKLISDVYNLNVTVKAHQTPTQCHRTLISNRKDIMFDIHSLKEQVIEQKLFGEDIF